MVNGKVRREKGGGNQVAAARMRTRTRLEAAAAEGAWGLAGRRGGLGGWAELRWVEFASLLVGWAAGWAQLFP